LRQPSEGAEHISTDRGVVVIGHGELILIVQLADIRAAWNDHLARSRGTCFWLGLIVLVENLADDLLQEVLHRHDARCAAVLVEHDRHVLF
jgi:hypothetical protein